MIIKKIVVQVYNTLHLTFHDMKFEQNQFLWTDLPIELS